MTTSDTTDRVHGWFAGRLPEAWRRTPADVTVDREEITVILTQPDVETGALGEGSGEGTGLRRARRGPGRTDAAAFREETREQRMEIAREAQHRFERKVSGESASARATRRPRAVDPRLRPGDARLRQPQRRVLDTLVESGVARSRSDALAWCVRLVGQHEGDWLAELREAMESVADVRGAGLRPDRCPTPATPTRLPTRPDAARGRRG